MLSLDEVLSIVDLLYAAALDPGLWPKALDRLATCAGGMGSVILSGSQMDPKSLSSERLHEANVDYGRNGWWAYDILRETGIRMGTAASGLFTHRDLVTSDTFNRHPFFQEFWRKHRIEASATYSTLFSPANSVFFSVQRGDKRGDFEPDDLRLLQSLGPHATRAFSIGSKIAESSARASSLEHLLDRFTLATFLITQKGRVLAFNAPAHRLLGRVFQLTQGRLQAVTSSGQKAVDVLLKAAFENKEAKPIQELILDPVSETSLLAQALKVPPRADSPFVDVFSEDLAFLILTETSPDPMPAAVSKLRTLGLTPSEARVASMIGAGFSPAEVAEQLEIKVATVRVQLKSIFMKLGVRRQSELAHLTTRLTLV